jgi:hypothetical protein
MMEAVQRNRSWRVRRRAGVLCAAANALLIALYPVTGSAQTTGFSVPPAAWGALALVLILLGALGFVIFVLLQREKEAQRQRGPQRRVQKRMPENPAWRDSGKGRRSRDPTDLRPMDEDLPPITLLTGATWAEKTQKEELPSQASLIAGAPETPTNVYKTGYNPFFRHNTTENIEVAEVADLVQQAELMLTLANYPAAISMLTRHIRDTEKPAPKAWLMLFDLYARTNREEQYANLAKGFRIQFNAEVPSWNAQKGEAARDLELYPQVMERVCKAWFTSGARALLESLLYDDRGGARAGFALPAYFDLIFLLDMLDSVAVVAREDTERRAIEAKLQINPLI